MSNQVSTQDVESLYLDHHGWLLGWLRRKLDNAFDAADLAHDTFVRLLRKRDAEIILEPRAYLCAIARDLASSYWRRQALEQAWLETLTAQPEPVVPSLEQRALILETLEQIVLMLDALPRRDREVFLLSQIDGLTYPQIAAQLGITVNIVQKAMGRALTQCYKVLYQDGGS